MSTPSQEFDPTDIHVALLKGGNSKEREVSLSSAEEVGKALVEVGFTVSEVDMGRKGSVGELEASGADVAFICLHGRGGEDGTVQGLCEVLGMPYTGSGVLSSATAMDKARSKAVYAQYGLPTPESITLKTGEQYNIGGIYDTIGPRIVVKPAREGSAIGIIITYTQDELKEAIGKAFALDDTVVLERYIQGLETTVGVLGNNELKALPVIEIVPTAGDFYDYEAKYAPGMSEHIIPARISDENTARCQELAIAAHKALGCRGFSRSDFIIDENECWLLETNTIPGMTPTSLLPDAAAAIGISFTELCTLLIALALDKS